MKTVNEVTELFDREVATSLSIDVSIITSRRNKIPQESLIVVENALTSFEGQGIELMMKYSALNLMFDNIYVPIIYGVLFDRLDKEISETKNKKKIPKMEKQCFDDYSTICFKVRESTGLIAMKVDLDKEKGE